MYLRNTRRVGNLRLLVLLCRWTVFEGRFTRSGLAIAPGRIRAYVYLCVVPCAPVRAFLRWELGGKRKWLLVWSSGENSPLPLCGVNMSALGCDISLCGWCKHPLKSIAHTHTQTHKHTCTRVFSPLERRVNHPDGVASFLFCFAVACSCETILELKQAYKRFSWPRLYPFQCLPTFKADRGRSVGNPFAMGRNHRLVVDILHFSLQIESYSLVPQTLLPFPFFVFRLLPP